MSEIKVDKISGKTSANAVTVTGENGSTQTSLQQGLIKIWINFNGTGDIAIRDSFNVSGINDEGTGDYTTTFTNSMSSGDYCETDGSLITATSRSTAVQGDTHSQLSGSLRIKYAASDDAADGTQASDITFVQQMFAGDLA